MIAPAGIEHNCRIVVLAALYFVEILSGTDTFFAKIFLGVGHNIPLRCRGATHREEAENRIVTPRLVVI
jgi:hypothetical protein